MSYSSTGTSSPYNNGMEGEILGLKLTVCVSNLPKKKRGVTKTPFGIEVYKLLHLCKI